MKFQFTLFLKIVVLLNVMTFSSVEAQSCLPNNLIITSQAEIDSFATNYPGCSIIEGHVAIFGPNDITNLNGLSQIVKIIGGLLIRDTHGLINLTGLDNLESTNNLFLQGNNNLNSLQGLENLTTIELGLHITEHDNLTTISALSNLSASPSVSIQKNNALVSLNGLENVTNVSDIFISYNNSLADLNGLIGATNLTGSINILANPLIQNLNGLNNLVSVGGHLSIYDNQSLTSLTGLESLTSISGSAQQFVSLDILLNPQLLNINSLSNLIMINGDLRISDNESLINIDGIRNIDATTIDQLYITNNDLLSNCAITSVCDYLDINPNVAEIYNNMPGCNSEAEVQVACDNLGIDEIETMSINIFPNPTSGKIEISGIPHGLATITDTSGRIVKEIFFKDPTLDISDLSQGVYFVSVQSNRKSTTKKIIKQN